MKHNVIGLDIAKSVNHLVDQSGKRKKLTRGRLLAYLSTISPGKIALEACSGAHDLGRKLQGIGHEVVLLPPQHIKGYLRGQKNDYNDAQALMEAALHGRVRPVPIKSVSQQDQQALVRSRAQLISERTRLGNQIRALLYEVGIVLPQGINVLRRRLPEALEASENGLTPLRRELVWQQYRRLKFVDEEVDFYTRTIEQQSAQDEVCQRLQAIPGLGVVNSYAFRAWIGDGSQFKRGRGASAALGVVPRQHSSGDKQVLLGITKRGDAYLRGLLIHGARAVARRASGKDDALSRWVTRLIAQRGFNKAIVALANKLVRIAWVIVARGEQYKIAAC